MCILTIHISSSIKFTGSLYNLVVSRLSDICITNIFPSLICLFIFLMVSDEQKFLILTKSSLSGFFLHLMFFCVLSRKSFPTLGLEDILPCFLLGAL